MTERYRSALIAIAKNEDNYIEEWLSYYDKLGISDCFLFLDDWKIPSFVRIDLIQKMRLHIIEISKIEKELALNEKDIPDKFYQRQIACYNYWISKYRNANSFNFAMFFDIDEFLVVPEMDLQKFFEKSKDFEAIGINWKIFGDNDLSFNGNDYSVLKRFTKASKTLFRNGKPCLNLNKAKNKNYFFKTTMHSLYGLQFANVFDIVKESYVRPKGWVYTADPHLLTDSNIPLYLCHFRNKTKQECLKKCSLHSIHQESYMDKFDENFASFNCNEIEDLTPKHFMEKN